MQEIRNYLNWQWKRFSISRHWNFSIILVIHNSSLLIEKNTTCFCWWKFNLSILSFFRDCLSLFNFFRLKQMNNVLFLMNGFIRPFEFVFRRKCASRTTNDFWSTVMSSTHTLFNWFSQNQSKIKFVTKQHFWREVNVCFV